MRKYYIVTAALLAVGIFAISVSGCNRNNNRTAMRSTNSQQPRRSRPAEVLSASASRAAPNRVTPISDSVVPSPNNYAVDYNTPAYQPAPSTPALAQSQIYSAPAYAAPVYAAPVYSAPAYSAPAPAYVPAPVVVAAAPSQQPVYAPVHPQPVMIAIAPIPELEPARSYRMPTKRPNRPVAEVMISERPIVHNRQEVIRALAPIPTVPVVSQQPVLQQPVWVAARSPP